MVAAVGSHGLLYHALLATWIVDAALAGDASRLPSELRRAEFANVVHDRLTPIAGERLAARQAEGESTAQLQLTAE